MTQGIAPAILRFVEARCLAAGVTTTQGIGQVAQTPRASMTVLRVADDSRDPSLPSARIRLAKIGPSDVAGVARTLKQSKCLLLHLAEGTDDQARSELESLRTPDGEWVIGPSLAVIHGTALGSSEFELLSKRGAAVVWSPLHDLLLYGQTLDIRAARAAGIRIGLGSSWTVTGSRNLLGELKWARSASRLAGGPLSDADLVATVTREAADILGWGRSVGSIVPGKRADVVVIDSSVDDDPYAALLEASEADVSLVLIDGVARSGTAELMGRFGRGTDGREVNGVDRVFDFGPIGATEPNQEAPSGTITLADAEERLRDALARLPELAARFGADRGDAAAEEFEPSDPDSNGGDRPEPPASQRTEGRSGVRAMRLDPLTIVDDPDYLPRLMKQPNIPKEIAREVASRSGPGRPVP